MEITENGCLATYGNGVLVVALTIAEATRAAILTLERTAPPAARVARRPSAGSRDRAGAARLILLS